MKKLLKLDWFSWLTIFFFIFLFIIRLVFLTADSELFFDVEEKASAYNARNLALFSQFKYDNNSYQPIWYLPLSNILSFPIFKVIGVGFFQLRIPYVFLSLIGIFFFYLIIKKETNRIFALLGIVLYGLHNFVLQANRSSLTENFFFVLPLISVYFLQLGFEKKKNHFFFWSGFFIFLSTLVKINGLVLPLIFFSFLIMKEVVDCFSDFKLKNILKSIFSFFLGTLPVLLIAGAIFLCYTLFQNFPHSELNYYKQAFGINLSNHPSLSLQILRQLPLYLFPFIPFIFANQTDMFLLFILLISILFVSDLKKLSFTDMLFIWWYTSLTFGNQIMGQGFDIKRSLLIFPCLIYLIIKVFFYLYKDSAPFSFPKQISFIALLSALSWLLFRNIPQLQFFCLEAKILEIVTVHGQRLEIIAVNLLEICIITTIIGKIISVKKAIVKKNLFFRVKHVFPSGQLLLFLITTLFFLFINSSFLIKVIKSQEYYFFFPVIFSKFFIATLTAILSYFVFRITKKTSFSLLSFSVYTVFFLALIINQYQNFILFLSHNGEGAPTYQYLNNSKELASLFKDRSPLIQGEEMAFRFYGFESKAKFVFNHDGPITEALAKTISEIPERKDIRFFFYSTYESLTPNDITNINTFKKAAPNLKIVHVFKEIYKGRDNYYFLFDKYPGEPIN
ncbi:MAG: glycosyltransferase family 39 protein [Patescibacteria group bacterium]|nr:glycosyltransferase family 39 protein [Patescibacteria group bacterium]